MISLERNIILNIHPASETTGQKEYILADKYCTLYIQI